MLQSALLAFEAAGAAVVGADEIARALGVAGAASGGDDCAAIVECLHGDGPTATIEEFGVTADLLWIGSGEPGLLLPRPVRRCSPPCRRSVGGNDCRQ
ncbi:polcalcin Jun o 2 [Panicum miliaceum]|uniref:Polcalcin Jun o 2 n=1 Tax=Panicum miliaceum TaxID=4540 RepID=A0A3L6RPN7_PANMI|nr:polcalcin Jun o 2 [Panicum miliaceum]